MIPKRRRTTKYRFVVSSAEEAVQVLRDRFGESAKVLSVKQIEGSGLARFLRAPKLEIIAEVPVDEEELPEEMPLGKSGRPAREPRQEPPVAPRRNTRAPEPEEEDEEELYSEDFERLVKGREAGMEDEALPDEPVPPPRILPVPRARINAILRNVAEAQGSPLAREPVKEPPVAEPRETILSSDLNKILLKGGIPDALLARLKSLPRWSAIAQMPIAEALNEVAGLLRNEYEALPKHPAASCVAFFGTPGVGKTTALCKRLTMDVFYNQRRAVVLKVDMETANSGEALATFCEALGVPMVRSLDSVPDLGKDAVLYIDCPGISCSNRRELADLNKLLNSMDAKTRVLVVNAAYDAGLIKQAYQMGSSLKATHVVFTHLDELGQWGKLWEFILDAHLTPLFLSSGQNIAGDFNESVFDAILQRSFPMVGKETALQTAAI